MSDYKITSPFKLDINAPIKFKKTDLYPFQKTAVDELEKFHTAGGKAAYGILKIPTGGGKTKAASYWITSNILSKNYKLVWIAHRKELLEQAAGTFNEMSGLLSGLTKKPQARLVVGGYSTGSQIKPSDDILFVSIQTLSKGKGERAFLNFIKKNKKSKILFVIDEAHHSEASTYRYIIKTYIHSNENYSLLGLTATPTRTVESEKSRLLKLFNNNIIYEVSLTELITEGFLARPIPKSVETNIEFEKSFNKKEEAFIEKFKELPPAVLKRIANSPARNKVIVDTYLKGHIGKNDRGEFGKTLIFATDIIHCKTLATEFQKIKGISVGYVHSGKADNDKVLSDFRNNKYDVLINVEKLTEGYDCPDIQTVFLARPTHSEILFSQMVGRGLRGPKSKPPGTETCYLVSFMDHWDKFTGWLDVSEVLDYSEPEEELEKKKTPSETETRIIPWDLIENIYNDLSQSLLDIPFKENIYDYLPDGWYTIEFFDKENNTPTSRRILVFENQIDAWKEVLTKLSKLKKKPLAKEVKELYNLHFEDLPIPSVIENDLKYLVDFAFDKDKFTEPEYHSFDEKREAEPKELATIIHKKDFTLSAKRNEISNWFIKHKILREIFENEAAFAREVDYQLQLITYQDDDDRFTIYSGNPFLKIVKKKLNIPKPDDAILKKYLKEYVRSSVYTCLMQLRSQGVRVFYRQSVDG